MNSARSSEMWSRRSVRRGLILSAGIIAVGGIIGYTAVTTLGVDVPPQFAPESPGFTNAEFTFRNILFNNLLVVGAIVGGVFMMAVPTLSVLMLNGALMGMILALEGPTTTAYLVVPHAVFELAAFTTAGAAAFQPLLGATAFLRDRREELVVSRDFRDAAKLVLLAVGLTMLGAAVEVFVTPRL